MYGYVNKWTKVRVKFTESEKDSETFTNQGVNTVTKSKLMVRRLALCQVVWLRLYVDQGSCRITKSEKDSETFTNQGVNTVTKSKLKVRRLALCQVVWLR